MTHKNLESGVKFDTFDTDFKAADSDSWISNLSPEEKDHNFVLENSIK